MATFWFRGQNMKNGHKMGQMASKLKNKTTFIFWTSTVWENKVPLVFSFEAIQPILRQFFIFWPQNQNVPKKWPKWLWMKKIKALYFLQLLKLIIKSGLIFFIWALSCLVFQICCFWPFLLYNLYGKKRTSIPIG